MEFLQKTIDGTSRKQLSSNLFKGSYTENDSPLHTYLKKLGKKNHLHIITDCSFYIFHRYFLRCLH